MKNFILILEVICLFISHINIVLGNENACLLSIEDYNLKVLSSDKRSVEFEIAGEKIIYEIDNDKIIIDDTEIILQTQIEIVDNSLGFTKEQLIMMEKESIIHQLVNEKMNRSGDLKPQVPANTSWKVVANFSKDIASIQGKTEDVLNKISLVTGLLSL